MRTHFQRPARAALWIAGISIGLFAVLGIAAIAPSVPDSLDATPGGDPPAGNPELRVEAAPVAAAARVRVRCPECGVVESIRQIGRSGADLAAGGAPDPAVAAGDTADNGYEVTVRLRDGSRTVFTEPSPRTWRPGSRVLVIGRAAAARN